MSKTRAKTSLVKAIANYPWWVSRLVTQHWPWVILGWLVIIVTVRSIAPSWSDIAADGDLAFLPDDVPSSLGRQAIEQAFPGSQSRSQMHIVLSLEAEKLSAADLALGLDAARRLHWLAARNARTQLNRASMEAHLSKDPKSSSDPSTARDKADVRTAMLVESLQDNLEQLVEIETDLAVFVESAEPTRPLARQLAAHKYLGEVYELTGKASESEVELETAQIIAEQKLPLLDDSDETWSKSIQDVYTWRNRVVGHKLADPKGHARLIAVQLNTEFMATANIQIMEHMESMMKELRDEYKDRLSPNLQVEVTGSAAVGADVLRASASGVKKTEVATVVLVLGILIAVYRSPLLVAIPIVSIIVSLVVATGLVALLARNPADPNSLGLGVFTTTRIFIVVLLFGAGTDFCLFLLARDQELLEQRKAKNRRQLHRILASGWRSVHLALVVSAATTIVGLSLMWFSRFEKFQFSGPVIAICLAVTLLVCLTLTPAILSGIGQIAFWPNLRRSGKVIPRSRRLWEVIARTVVSRPALALSASLLLLLVPAVYGLIHRNHVTYDLTAELSRNSPSRRGERIVKNHFAANHGSPLTIILTREVPFESEEQLRKDCSELASVLYIEGVESVRSLTDPLGDYPPGKHLGVTEKDSWRKLILTNHRITRQHYLSDVSALKSRVAKLDVVFKASPFSLDAAETLDRLSRKLGEITSSKNSNWYGATMAISGTAIGITDLREVTQSDQLRIQILVTIGVWVVLLFLLRNWQLAGYLMLTVLVSYFATLGITQWVFKWMYGIDFHGLDWKVPLFLFVILVAVGQDYNVYLVTRIKEEQKLHPNRHGVERALFMTGGIITSCGIIMAGTFVAMISPAISLWLSGQFPQWFADDIPVLRGITELGFALSFGILLDTILVRSILVPAFVVLWQANPRNQPLTAG